MKKAFIIILSILSFSQASLAADTEDISEEKKDCRVGLDFTITDRSKKDCVGDPIYWAACDTFYACHIGNACFKCVENK